MAHMTKAPVSSVGLLVAALCIAAACPAALVAQDTLTTQVTVTGTVVSDENATPIAGVAVTVPNTRLGTYSDERGHFTIRVRSTNDTLSFMRIGFARQLVPLDGRTTVDVRLRATAVTLGEIVTVGYGTQKRSDITGSVASVSTEQIENKPNTSVIQALEGRIPGVNVTTTGSGAEPTLAVQIRGRSSITANASPLVVVDGIPFNGSISDINPEDIASLEVLKDASAAAIYGSRGSNGVLLITTKKGTEGGPPRIAYSAYAGTQTITNMPHLMTGPEFAQFKCVRLNSTADCDAVLTATEQDNLAAGKYADWVGIATHRGTQQNHNLSVSGGGSGTRYFIGGSFLGVDGVALNDHFDRYSVRLNLDQTLRDWLTLGTNTNVAYANRSGVPASFSAAFLMNPLTNPYDASGHLTVTPWSEDTFWPNPLQGLLATDDDRTRSIFSSNYALVTVPWVKGLTYRLNGGIDFSSRVTGRYYGQNTRNGAEVQGLATTLNADRRDWTLENIVRYVRAFGNHNFDLTGLYSAQANNRNDEGLRAQGFPSDVLTYHQATVAALLVPNDTVVVGHQISQMGRLNYNYADRYLATFTTRRDGFSGFGANHKYGIFPSLALGWNVSNESFWRWSSWVDALKLRASYGSNGNQAIRPYSTLAQFDDYSYLNGGITAPGYRPVTLGTPDLRWETTNAVNVGLDFTIRKGRVQGSIDGYQKNTRDLLLRRSISPTHGLTSLITNVGRTQNRGFELALSTLNLQTAGLTWRSDFNLAANRNRIVDLYGNGLDDINSGWFIGQPIDVNYGYKFAGIFQDSAEIANSAQKTAKPGDVKIQDTNGDGKIDATDRTLIGRLEPKYTLGFSNSVSYRGFTLSALLRAVQGITRANDLLQSNLVQTNVRQNTILLTYWTPENHLNTYPKNSETSNPLAVAFYQDASFVRLKDLTLAYDVPGSFTTRLGSQTLRVYVSGRNLWTSTDWTGLDPELNDQRQIPLEKTIIGGINIRF
jgi:TonB-linked SusC/RagA family outer membrane protein